MGEGAHMQVSGPGTNAVQATLLDTGNFVLRDTSNSSKVFWHSFDEPTDTLLPGMIIGLKGMQNQLLTSWASSHDPAPGIFSFGFDPNRTNQLFIWQRGDVYWTSGAWNGKSFTLAPEMTRNSYIYFVSNDNAVQISYFNNYTSIYSRYVMSMSGQFQFYFWFDRSQQWLLYWAQPRDYLCLAASSCGANGICNSQESPTCECLQGFEPISIRQWESGVWSEGCTRKVALECATGDGFLQLTKVKLPVSFSKVGYLSTELVDCKDKCMSNCSCTAYASADPNGAGCLLWFGDLTGLQENYTGGQDLYFRVAASELSRDQGKKKILWIIIAAALTGIVLLCVVFVCWLRRKKLKQKGKNKRNQELLLYQIVSDVADANKHGEREKGPGFSLFSFVTIATATESFSATNKLGEGGFGPVYKGKLPEGQEIAVKRLSESSGQGFIEFQNEIVLIAKLQHMNLVRLFGCCIEEEEKILIYEYLPNKSLDFYIFDPSRSAELDWSKRFHIIEGIAQGLLYLHKYSRLRIIHRDLKASNILLDSEMNPKISDFGMARVFGRNESQVNTNRVVGTYGYMSPEYAMEGLFSEKSDVFSFGVLLLEIVSGKRNTSVHHFGHSLNLLGYAWELWNNGRVSEMVDPLLVDSCPTYELPRCIHVGLLCVQESAIDRPNMSSVISMLGSETASLPTPKQPAFSTGRTTAEADLALGRQSCSLNVVTVSGLEGR